MKKTMLAILLCGVMVLGITGCGSSNTFDVGNVSDVEISNNNDVTFSIKDDTLKNTGATFILKNDSDMDVQYGDSYEIEIEKLYTSTNRNNKNMIIKVTDERLLEKTGGIIQGMSGSPIIQNGKFVGAVTHVMVNNPEKGYGIFADTMLKQMKSVEEN